MVCDTSSVAENVARALASRDLGIVYGGGRVGLMGVIADAALQAGGEVTGVIPQSLAREEIAHGGLTKLHVVHSMHERKALMADLSDGFIALPGGFGTMDEFCEILTWAQLNIHAKPIGLLNAYDYYALLLAFVREHGERRVCHAAQPRIVPIGARDRSAARFNGLLARAFSES